MRISPAAIASSSPLSRFRQRLLLREFIQRSLYDPVHGYFSNTAPPLLQHSQGLDFTRIASRSAYQDLVAKTYAHAHHGWMTPVELFTPYLSRAIANRIRSVAPSDKPLNIIEVGAGRGTLARDILDHWQDTDPEFLRYVSYSIVEISPALTQVQSETLKSWVADGVVSIHNSDALLWFRNIREDPKTFRKLAGEHCHVVAAEVLDNLPHDLVRTSGSKMEQAVIICEEELSKASRSFDLEWTSDIDALTEEAVEAFPFTSETGSSKLSSNGSILLAFKDSFEQILGGGTQEVWIPTASFQFLSAISSSIPHAHLTVADFDSLPGACPGRNGPVIQSVDKGSAVVFDSICSAPFGKVDIMFPTDFHALLRAHEVALGKREQHVHIRRVLSQQQFFDEFSSEVDKINTTCQDGYNPVLQDFANASLLLADHIRAEHYQT